jgi:hypothetical protein
VSTALRREKGQASVEFAIFSLILFFALLLIVQLMWFGIQKWQFNHFAAYSARVWSVEKEYTPSSALYRTQLRALLRWGLIKKDWVKLMWSSGIESRSFDEAAQPVEGVRYRGVAPAMAIYRPLLGEMALDEVIPGEVSALFPGVIPKSGLVSFGAFIPMRKEPTERPYTGTRYNDNDCDDTPCTKGNRR